MVQSVLMEFSMSSVWSNLQTAVTQIFDIPGVSVIAYVLIGASVIGIAIHVFR